MFRVIGFAVQKRGYTQVRGVAAEKSLHSGLKVMTWNICGIGGGLSLDHGGVVHWRSRLGAVVDKIKTEDPDVLVLQEIYETSLAEALIEKLQSTYAHIFLHLGPNSCGSVDGGMIFSKCAVHNFSHTLFANNDWSLHRGFSTLEVKANPDDAHPCIRIIGTHLIDGDKTKRTVQVMQIVNYLKQTPLLLPTILVGDLNIERDQEEGAMLSFYLNHGYEGSEPTRTNGLVDQWDLQSNHGGDETIDYISLFKSPLSDGTPVLGVDPNVSLENCHLVEAYDHTMNTQTALSDHHGLSAVVRI